MRDRKGSKMGYELALFSRDEMRIPGQAALSSLKKTTFLFDGGSPFGAPKLSILQSLNHPSTEMYILIPTEKLRIR